jgi:hypothetical protein
MTYGFVMDVPAPIEVYDAVHAEVGRRTTSTPEGLLFHLGRATSRGFQVVEVWESKELSDRYNGGVVGPVIAELSGQQTPAPEPVTEEFEVRGLVIPAANVMV